MIIVDPTANLAEQLRLAREIHKLEQTPTGGERAAINERDDALIEHGGRLADLVVDLNHWVTTGGFLPATWQRD